MTGLFRYSIIRFRPFAETGEFANIGVVATEIGSGATDFRLAPVRFGRIRHFFDEVGYEAYRLACRYLRKELERVGRSTPLLKNTSDEFFFNEIYRERESSVLFSEARILKSADHLFEVTEYLYGRYVGRNFTGVENVEADLTKNLRRELKSHGVNFLKTIRVENEVVPIVLPLAYLSDHYYAIKPLAFSQKTPLTVFDHGASWKNRFEYLLDRNVLQPNNIFLAIEPPVSDDPAFTEAFQQVEEQLDDLPFERIIARRPSEMIGAVVNFAKNLPVDNRILRMH